MHLRPKGIGDFSSARRYFPEYDFPSNALTAERHWRQRHATSTARSSSHPVMHSRPKGIGDAAAAAAAVARFPGNALTSESALETVWDL